MGYDVILELMDGRREEAEPVRPFQPAENEISVKLARSSSTLTFQLSEVCFVLMNPKEHLKTFLSHEQTLEEVITVTGNRYHTAVLKDQPLANGFYGLSRDLAHPYKLIFFTTGGVKTRREDRRIGAVLEEKGLVTHYSIEKALNEQNILRKRRLGDIVTQQQDLPRQAIEHAIERY